MNSHVRMGNAADNPRILNGVAGLAIASVACALFFYPKPTPTLDYHPTPSILNLAGTAKLRTNEGRILWLTFTPDDRLQVRSEAEGSILAEYVVIHRAEKD